MDLLSSDMENTNNYLDTRETSETSEQPPTGILAGRKPVLSTDSATLFDDWKTPLLWAIENQQHACAAELMNWGARTDTCDRRGNTALHVACFVGDPDMTRLICKHTMELNSLNSDGCSPLHIAAKHGFLKTVRELLLAGANPEVRNKSISPYVMFHLNLNCMQFGRYTLMQIRLVFTGDSPESLVNMLHKGRLLFQLVGYSRYRKIHSNSAESLICDVFKQLNVLHQATSCFTCYNIRCRDKCIVLTWLESYRRHSVMRMTMTASRLSGRELKKLRSQHEELSVQAVRLDQRNTGYHRDKQILLLPERPFQQLAIRMTHAYLTNTE
ncbi:hypothetical protein T265_04083 [Opisthorchis viverrini]|uniref:Uncharacterized protein n=1 Tax=Opisthorchis viverrini TaxID=6198 RepID=A0A075A146_OPIVI|nr:hypothetical protein T265_04083 [Opisthorchis viverrini]KER29235.1 hypothetical protein T265_04083 [Opisthorchis viverrini]